MNVTGNDEHLGTRVRHLRKVKELRVEDLACITGLASRTITRIESGKDASLPTLRRLAKALDVSVVDLLALPVEDEQVAS